MEPSLSCKVNGRRKCYIPGAMFGPFSFINVFSGGDAENDMKNMVEIAVAFRIMQLLYKSFGTPLSFYSFFLNFYKAIGCFHEYQPGEADVVIISTVGSADEDEANTDANNTNVYLTWARHCLWILGDETVHLKGVWKSLIVEAKASGCFFRADENKDLAKVIFEVKKDLQQLDELLGGESTLFRNTTWKCECLDSSNDSRISPIPGVSQRPLLSLYRGSEYPMKWPAASQIIQYTTHANHCDEMGKGVENVKVCESLILMKFYSLSTRAVNAIIHGCDGGDIGIPFELTEQEKHVVSFDKSSFIIGRSGTGKTTVLTMKLFQNEQLHHLACEGVHEVIKSKEEAKQDVLRQLFVTFSSKLCYAVGQNFGEWKRLSCGGGSSSQSSPTCIDDINQLMLSEDTPEKFIHLSHDVYPLIITFHRFLFMLDGTLTKNLDPSTVYTEIMSVIKGGLVTDKAFDGILLRDDYAALSDGRTSIFDAQKREVIYSIFLQYENKKVENGNFDLSDLVNDLHQRLEVEGYTGEMMDYVYVDETSRIDGDLPILLETDTNNDAIKFIFERNGYCSQLITGFGAEQVVLVRDESLKEKVFDVVGKNALVLTIMESKGLEFQDVLLFDFFTTSSFSNEWRIIYNYMNDKDLLNSLCSCFDMQKHAVLCSELKQLYVAITRTRQRLWICESTGFSGPIYDYWKKLRLVEVKHLSDSFADKMQIPSSIDEWRS
ncbi:hypothetical protein L1987_39546 [Smallanthus sonchifolius]|uniref:Uncharacterized protein n=1 Tax=Smallanthus sonchifolius TaxID=185202 RepID=A0ACB9HMB1_9ASTR|nr:hypothetical protein L1987_39546 [Smallanthus sonchifolius]